MFCVTVYENFCSYSLRIKRNTKTHIFNTLNLQNSKRYTYYSFNRFISIPVRTSIYIILKNNIFQKPYQCFVLTIIFVEKMAFV